MLQIGALVLVERLVEQFSRPHDTCMRYVKTVVQFHPFKMFYHAEDHWKQLFYGKEFIEANFLMKGIILLLPYTAR